MNYAKYFTFDVAGGFSWVWGMTLLGYWLGRTVPNIDKRIHFVIAGVIVVSFLPGLIHYLRIRGRKGAGALKGPAAEED